MTQTKQDVELDQPTKDLLGETEMDVLTSYTLADALREGSKDIAQARRTWGDGENSACALTTIVVAAQKRGYL